MMNEAALKNGNADCGATQPASISDEKISSNSDFNNSCFGGFSQGNPWSIIKFSTLERELVQPFGEPPLTMPIVGAAALTPVAQIDPSFGGYAKNDNRLRSALPARNLIEVLDFLKVRSDMKLFVSGATYDAKAEQNDGVTSDAPNTLVAELLAARKLPEEASPAKSKEEAVQALTRVQKRWNGAPKEDHPLLHRFFEARFGSEYVPGVYRLEGAQARKGSQSQLYQVFGPITDFETEELVGLEATEMEVTSNVYLRDTTVEGSDIGALRLFKGSSRTLLLGSTPQAALALRSLIPDMRDASVWAVPAHNFRHLPPLAQFDRIIISATVTRPASSPDGCVAGVGDELLWALETADRWSRAGVRASVLQPVLPAEGSTRFWSADKIEGVWRAEQRNPAKGGDYILHDFSPGVGVFTAQERELWENPPPPQPPPIPLPTFEQLPPFMQELAGKRVWFAYWGTKPDGRINKAPRNPRTGGPGASDNLEGTAGTFAEARAMAARHNGGVGLALGLRKDGLVLCGADIDSCLTPGNPFFDSWAQDTLGRVDSYIEVSPSGTGVKSFFWMREGEVVPNFKVIKGSAKKREVGKHPPAVEFFSGGIYFTITAQAISKDMKVVPAEEVVWLRDEFGPEFTGANDLPQKVKQQAKRGRPRKDMVDKVDSEKVQTALDAIDPRTLTRDEWLNVGMALHDLAPDDEGMEAWDVWSQLDAERYEAKAIASAWKSFGKRRDPNRPKITLATLFHLAKQRGWDWTPTRTSQTGIWPDGVQRDGTPKKGLQNTKSALEQLGITVVYDQFTMRYLFMGQRFSDKHARHVRDEISKRFGFDPGKDDTFEVLKTIGDMNEIHVVREYFDGLEWDGVERVGTWLSVYLGAPDTELNRAIGRSMLMACVRRSKRPGCKYDEMVILEGPQGNSKSTALQTLAGAAFYKAGQAIAESDTKKLVEGITGTLIYEVGELSAFKKSEVTHIKEVLSRQVDVARPAYGREVGEFPRQGIFVGTSNESHYLRDKSGNRRFLPVKTGEIDLPALERDRHQLWAEACVLEAKGLPLFIPKDLWALAAVEQGLRMEEDVLMEEKLLDIAGDGHTLLVDDGYFRIASKALTDEIARLRPDSPLANGKRLADAVRAQKWRGTAMLYLGRDHKVKSAYEKHSALVWGEQLEELVALMESNNVEVDSGWAPLAVQAIEAGDAAGRLSEEYRAERTKRRDKAHRKVSKRGMDEADRLCEAAKRAKNTAEALALTIAQKVKEALLVAQDRWENAMQGVQGRDNMPM